ncbi:MAG: PorT family protein [Bacteroidales bacterium]|nr:PorT family protein [Bacteroidales bacterium]MCF8457697.1 PorT family protein [Bacteroidales bacterium]
MKKLALIVCLLISLSATAQEFKGGIMAGFITSQVDGDSWAGYNKSGFSAGFFVNRQFNTKLAGQMELRYIRKGAIHDDTKTGGSSYYRSRLNYAEVPLMVQYFKGNFIFEGGGTFGVLINSTEEDLYGKISENELIAFNKIEIGSLIGFSYQVFEKLRINFRFQYSILPIRTNYSDNISTVNDYYNQKYSFNNVLGFSVYYFL